MPRLWPRSFGNKLILLVVLASGVAVVLACGLLILFDYARLRDLAVRTLSTQADIIGTHSQAALLFDDRDAGAETLAALRADPNVAAATLYDAAGELFAAYHQPGSTPPAIPHGRRSPRFEHGWLVLEQPVVEGGQRLGSLQVVYSMQGVHRRLRWSAAVGLAVAVLAIGVALLLALRLERVLARPVAELVRTARNVSQAGDTAARARKFSDDELGQFTDAFNEMLGQLDAQRAQIERAHEEFRTAVEGAPNAMVMTDAAGRILMVNAQTEQLFGYRRAALIGQAVEILLPRRFHDLYVRHRQGFVAQPSARPMGAGRDLFGLRQDGTEFPVEVALSPIQTAQGMRVLAAIADITLRKRAEESLLALNETLEQRVAQRTAEAEQRTAQLRELAAELTQAEERERRRLAQTLHDHLQQLLVAVQMRLGMAAARATGGPLRESLGKAAELLKQSIAVSRSLTIELSPPVLYDAGLAAALHWLARMMREKHGLEVSVEADEAAEPDAQEIRTFLFQATRELLFNVVKHAGVSEARLTMSAEGAERVRITVADAGDGFEGDAIGSARRSEGGFGLFSIRERLVLLGGEMEVHSAPGRGTRIALVAARRAPAPPPGAAAQRPAAHAAEPASRIRVVLADDHEMLREGLVGLLREEKDIAVIGQAADGQAAVEMARRLRPDVVVMDVTMPRLSGLEATRLITAELPEVRVIGLSMHDEQDLALQMRSAGAVDYLTKGGPIESLANAIRGAVQTGAAS